MEKGAPSLILINLNSSFLRPALTGTYFLSNYTALANNESNLSDELQLQTEETFQGQAITKQT